MRNVGRVFFTTLVGLTLVVAVWAFSPPTTQDAALLSLSNNQAAAQEQSVSGKIASVEKNSFTLTVGQSHTSAAAQDLQQDPASPKTMTFQIDKNTTIEGSLKVGANADVTYRQEKGTNIAISVRVTP
jgi:Cu/Ag efflux protein CusF